MRSAPVAWSFVLGFAAAAPAQVVLNPTIPNLLVTSCAHSGDTVHALGIVPTGSSTTTAFYARSTDGGRTWPLRELPLLQGAITFNSKIAASGNTVVALLLCVGGLVEVHSNDGGTTWSSQRMLVSYNGSLTFELLVDGATVNVFYYVRTYQFGGGWLWQNRSTDGGATWLATPRQLDGTNGLVWPAVSPHQQCVSDGADLHVFWKDTVSSSTVMHQRSSDGGATWLPTPQNMGLGQSVHGIVASNGVLFVGTHPPQRSIDRGTTWSPTPVPPGLSSSALFAGDGANVLAAEASASGSVVLVRVTTSVDGGLTWRSLPVTLVQSSVSVPSATFALIQLHPFVVGDALYVHVDVRDWSWGVLLLSVLAMSVDQGATWRTLANLDENYWPAPSRIVATGNTLPQTYVRVLAGHTIVGAGTTGSGGIDPQLHGVGIPAPGLDFTLELTHALGGSFALLGFGVGAPVSVPFGSATVFVPLPITSLIVPTGGSTGVPGSGGFTWVQRVPNSLVFAGLQLVSQGLVWDAGAADGFAVTAGVMSELH